MLALQLPVLALQAIENAKKILPNAVIVAIYQFATAQAVNEVQEQGIPTLKWPVSWSEIEHTALSGGLGSGHAGQTIARRFSDEELIALAATSDDPSQCPQHLIESIHQLNALAAFISECPTAPARRRLYQRACADATAARAQLEMALESLISNDNATAARAQGFDD